MPVTLQLDLPPRLPKPVEIGAYYLVAEALTNANKHARAHFATVRGEIVDGALRVSVSDDGIGGAAASARSGLEGLGDRISALGGELLVASPPGGGTTVTAEIPLARVPASAADHRRMRALKWVGFHQWEMPPEAFEQVTDEDNLTAARGTLLLAGGNEHVTPLEREWLVGYHTVAGTADWVLDAITSGADPGTLAELTIEPGLEMIARSLVYDALRMCSADSPLTPAELDRIEGAAGSIGIAADVVSDLAEIVAADEALRRRRYDVVAAPLLPQAAYGTS